MKGKIQSISDFVKALPLPRLLLPTLSLFGVLIIILLIWKVPQWQARGIADAKDRATIENAARGTFVQAVGGLFLFITAYFTAQNLKVTQQNLIATQQKQVTELFAKAIEQLGNASIHVRLGAMYALERISKDSDQDYWQVMEILTAYVRETSPYPPRDQTDKPSLETNSQLNTTDNQDPSAIATDIQAVLTVITRRSKSFDQGEQYPLDFSKTNLSSANLYDANLSSANLSSANLSSANLYDANLIGANLIGANLYDANLIGANLIGAKLSRAKLSRAKLSRADLSRADLSRANLYDANLNRANLIDATLSLANLSSAYLSLANLSSADLSLANLIDADLSYADLSRAKNLTPEQVKKAKNWGKAKYDEEFRAKLGLPPVPDE